MKTKIKNINFRRGLFLVFAFAMTATLSFLAIHNMTKTDAASFQAGDIISDAVMANYGSMSEADINNFMHSKNSCNDTNLSKRNKYPNLTYQIRDGHFICLADQTFNGQSSAHIIWQAAQDYRINPQVLLVLLQKEQSLITDTWPDDQQIRKATGFACTDSAPCDQSKSGFENQIRKAAALYRTVLDGGWTNYPVGNNYVQYNPNTGCGGTTIYIANRATSSLYRYTPYQPNAAALNGGGDSCSAYGNLNFWKYFTNWFGDTHAIADYKSTYVPEGIYTLSSISGKNLSFSGSNNNTPAQINGATNTYSQKFQIIHSGEYYKIKDISSGRYLDISAGNMADGTRVQIYDENDTCAQKWIITMADNSTYKIVSSCSPLYLLDISGGAINSNGAKVQIWSNNNTNAQKWIIKNTEPQSVSNGIYNLTTKSGKSIALTNETTKSGTKIITGELHSAITERFQLSYNDDGSYKIQNVAAGIPLDVSGGGSANGTSVQIYNNNNTCAQRWFIMKNNDAYNIASACSGKVLDINGGDIQSSNVKIQIWEQNNTEAQLWFISSPRGQSLDDGIYNIESALSDKFNIDTDNSRGITDGSNLQIWAKSNNSNEQKYQITYDQDTGYYNIRNIFADRSVDVAGGSVSSKANVRAWTSNDTCAQKWMIEPINNHYQIMSGCSRMVLDVAGGNARNGTNIRMFTPNYTASQQWSFNPAPDTSAISIEKTYTFESALNSDLSLSINSSSPVRNSANVRTEKIANLDTQYWKIRKNGTKYQFIDKTGNYALDVSAAGVSNGSNVQIWNINNTCAQKWNITYGRDGYYTVRSACSNKPLDVTYGSRVAGANIQIWENNNTYSQKWKIKQRG